jgi:hypothetical protein
MSATIMTDGVTLVVRFLRKVRQRMRHYWKYNKDEPAKSCWTLPVRPNVCGLLSLSPAACA